MFGPMRKGAIALVIAASLVLPAATAAGAPNDPLYGAQQPLALIHHSAALDAFARKPVDIPVFLPDTGVDIDHPDLVNRLFRLPANVPAPSPDGFSQGTVLAGQPGWDLIGNDLNPPPGPVLTPDPDPNAPPGSAGTGTLVAGALGAQVGNGIGTAGVAPNARIIALRSCWEFDSCFQYIQAAAINWAADRGARVIAFHTLFGSTPSFEAGFRAAIANHPNVLFIAIPSGNDGPLDADPLDEQPCNLDLPNVMCVTASSPTGGPDCGRVGPRVVDLAVPVRNNVVTADGGGTANVPQCFISYAPPIAAGVATVLFGLDPAASPAQVKAAMMDSATRVPAWAGKSVSGGVLDMAAAVDRFQVRRGLVKPPVLGRQVNVAPVSGKVTVSLPRGASLSPASNGARAAQIKGRKFVPLNEARQIPVGSFIDTRRGTVSLTSARDTRGRTQAGRFTSGVFQILQSRKRSQKGVTELRLKGTNYNRCGFVNVSSEVESSRRKRRKSRKRLNRLRGNAKGRFRSRGRYSSATVRGTRWTTEDRCNGTFTSVQRGRVDVRDFRRKKTIKLRTGKRYLAKAP